MDKERVPRLSLDLLRGFHAAARHLSFTRAASELFVTQPAISIQIKTLEEQLGQPLFRRANRTLQLTPAGEELYRCADEVFALVDSTLRRLSGSAHSLAVTAPVPFASISKPSSTGAGGRIGRSGATSSTSRCRSLPSYCGSRITTRSSRP